MKATDFIFPSRFGDEQIDGLTIRAYIATKAMAALIMHAGNGPDACAKLAVEYADALIAELNKS